MQLHYFFTLVNPCFQKLHFYLNYIGSSALEDWLRVTKTNGIISFTHKSKVWPNWEPTQKKLEDDMKWKMVWTSEPLQYLPSYQGNDLSERVKVYIYQKV